MPRTRSIAWAELKLGLIGIAATALAVMVIIAVGGQGGFFWERYPLKTQVLDAQGLKSGAVVRVAGKDVGSVTSVEFVGTMIEIAFEVNKDVRPLVTDRSVATIGSLGLLGEPLLDVKAGPQGTTIPDWGYVKFGGSSGIGSVTESASESLKKAGELIEEIRAGKGTLGKIVVDDALYRELQQFVGAAADLAERLRDGDGTFGRLVNDPAVWNSLKTSLENLQTVTARLNSRESALGRFLYDEALGRSLSNTLTNIDEASARFNRPDSTVGKLLTEKELYDRVNALAGRLDSFAAGLNSGEGTVGRLLRDQQLYDNMNRAVTEIHNLLADIRKDPRKFLRVSVSIF
jgi:phospholipid/cholesterol/gamma-HCH transport system substrate-binding protein